jgi:arylsulfatase A-like enzyme
MKAVVVMFDSLNRHMLPPYGGEWVHAPNFARLAHRAVTFDRSYVCSMPCMPARRDFLTGRPNFLHRSWGPLEPFDDSFVRQLRAAGVPCHFVSDHYHYWEPGGCTYHTEYTTWQFFRGQEGDAWMGQVAPLPPAADAVAQNASDDEWHRQDRINRQFMRHEGDQPSSGTFRAGLDFIERNHQADNWLLQIETFDPHEPFYANRSYRDLYPGASEGPLFDWPGYRPVAESPAEVEHCRQQYAALVSQCDARLGDVLDAFDRLGLWDDTMLIVWTDHGFLLGEHDSWGKVWLPFFEEISHTPFFVWDPRRPCRDEHRGALVQPSLDLGPTLLRYFGQEPTADMLGCDLSATIAGDAAVRRAAMFGLHGAHVNVTDGRYVYWRAPAAPDNQPLYNYTLMPSDMRALWAPARFEGVELAPPFGFTKGVPTLKAHCQGDPTRAHQWGSRLYDLQADPRQARPLADPEVEAAMTAHLVELMTACQAPPEQFERLGLS